MTRRSLATLASLLFAAFWAATSWLGLASADHPASNPLIPWSMCVFFFVVATGLAAGRRWALRLGHAAAIAVLALFLISLIGSYFHPESSDPTLPIHMASWSVTAAALSVALAVLLAEPLALAHLAKQPLPAEREHRKMTYPKVYKPGRDAVLVSGFFILLILFLLFTQVFPLSAFRLYQLHDAKFWVAILGLVIVSRVMFYLAIVSIGYRVTYLPDAIQVTTLLGTKTMQYSDISFYRWKKPGSRGGVLFPPFYTLYLVSRGPTQGPLDISSSKGPNERKLKIPLNLRLDQEFEDWIASVPCEPGQPPLPN